MKTIGLIGGMSWESSAEYYRLINQEVKRQLGGLHSAQCLMYSLDFAVVETYQANGEWEKAGQSLTEMATALEHAGADFIIICTNTMHKVVDYMEARIHIPILHIADATANKIQERRLRKVGLLGTTYTMEQSFYTSRIERHDIEVLTPSSTERERVNKIIYGELCLGALNPSSKQYYLEVIRRLIDQGAEGIILGCTEIGLLIRQEDIDIPIFDTAKIHALAAANYALQVD